MKAVIITGGYGTRLRPLTYTTPKGALPIVGVPLVLRQIEFFKRFGVKDFILCTNYLFPKIKKIIEQEKSLKGRVYFAIEKKPLGTCGAVKNACKYFDSEPLIVANGDILTNVNIDEVVKFHKQSLAKVTIVLAEVSDPTSYGLVVLDKSNRVLEFIEKPNQDRPLSNTINAGIYIIEPDVFADVPESTEYSFERELFPKMLQRKEKIFGFKMKEFWIDVGSPLKYIQANRAVLEGELKFEIHANKTKDNVFFGNGVKLAKDTDIFGPAYIGDKTTLNKGSRIYSLSVVGKNVELGEESSVYSSIIFDNVKIGKGVLIKDCIIGSGCVIEDDVQISGGIVLSDKSNIKKGTKIGIQL